MTSLRNDDVSITLARFNELQVHRFHRLGVSFNDGFHCLASFNYVPGHDSHQSVIIVCIHENLDIHLVAEFLAREHQNTFNDDDVRWFHRNGFGLRS